MTEQYLWVEKYRPRSVDECILPSSLKEGSASDCGFW